MVWELVSAGSVCDFDPPTSCMGAVRGVGFPAMCVTDWLWPRWLGFACLLLLAFSCPMTRDSAPIAASRSLGRRARRFSKAPMISSTIDGGWLSSIHNSVSSGYWSILC